MSPHFEVAAREMPHSLIGGYDRRVQFVGITSSSLGDMKGRQCRVHSDKLASVYWPGAGASSVV